MHVEFTPPTSAPLWELRCRAVETVLAAYGYCRRTKLTVAQRVSGLYSRVQHAFNTGKRGAVAIDLRTPEPPESANMHEADAFGPTSFAAFRDHPLGYKGFTYYLGVYGILEEDGWHAAVMLGDDELTAENARKLGRLLLDAADEAARASAAGHE